MPSVPSADVDVGVTAPSASLGAEEGLGGVDVPSVGGGVAASMPEIGGGVGVPSGSAAMPSGSVEVPSGSVDMPSADVKKPKKGLFGGRLFGAGKGKMGLEVSDGRL